MAKFHKYSKAVISTPTTPSKTIHINVHSICATPPQHISAQIDGCFGGFSIFGGSGITGGPSGM